MAENHPDIKISVRELVSFVLRKGDIDASYKAENRLAEGVRLHSHLQRLRKQQMLLDGGTYKKEVSLSLNFSHAGLSFHVEGRADGIFSGGTYAHPTIEEIKSTTKPLDTIENDPEHWHWAQAKCYGYFYCIEHNTQEVGVQLTFIHVDTEETMAYQAHFTLQELETFFFQVVDMYAAFALLDMEAIARRNATCKALTFPYDQYRQGQRDLAVAVYKTIATEKKLFVQAPTGTGKTVSCLFPAIKALGEGLLDKVFYATAKTTTRTVAEEALALMTDQGLALRHITLTAKDKICFMEKTICNPVDCPFAKGHFDRVNDALLDLLGNETAMPRPVIEAYGQKHQVCPFELAMDAASFCDCIIGDYNHVYDPNAQMKRFFGETAYTWRMGVLHDEAHNLVDRSLDMFSAELTTRQVTAARQTVRGKNTGVYKALGNLKKWMQDAGKEPGVTVIQPPPAPLFPLLQRFAEKCDTFLAEEAGTLDNTLLEMYFSVRDFLNIWCLWEEEPTCFAFFIDSQQQEVAVRLLCLDAAPFLKMIQKRLTASLFFSATLTPVDYFISLLGGDVDAASFTLPSPFPAENLCLLVDDTVSTLYKNREDSITPIAQRLYALVNSKKGRYLAFFPSYAYMEQVVQCFTAMYPEMPVLMQAQGMTEEDRQQFLAHFSHADEWLLGFTVLGGVFSEGIDFVGNRLIGAAIVGVGLPMLNPRRNVMQDYYKSRKLNGFDYAYRFPGMNKVLQAAGRVIRSPKDRGVVALLDSRFTSPTYRGLFPAEWAGFTRVKNERDICRVLEQFWNKGD